MTSLERVERELARYEHPLFRMACREKNGAVEITIDCTQAQLGLHTYYFEMHPRDLEHPQFEWTFQRQLYNCMHDYMMEMFTRTPQDING